VLVTSARHERALSQAAEALRRGREAVEIFPGRWEDRVASHLRECLARLGEILGEGTSDEVLKGIFARFCIGK
jgi:tRNA modification GTPase